MIYSFTCAIARLICRVFFRIRVTGLEKVPRDGPLIVASNHASTMDPVVVGAFLPRKVHYIAKDELFRNPVFGWFLRQIGVFPIARGRGAGGAIKLALEFLADGQAVGIFPEGTRSLDGTLGPAQPGMAMMAARSGAPILSVGLLGTFEAFPKGSALPKPRRVEFRVSELFTPESLGLESGGHGDEDPPAAEATEDSRRQARAAERKESRRRLEAAGATVMASIGRVLQK